MELTWSESYLITALRVLIPFFRQRGFHLANLEFGSRDGDYLIFEQDLSKDIRIEVIYNPGFDIIIYKKSYNLFFPKTNKISLVKEREQFKSFPQLPYDYKGEEGLSSILKDYTTVLDILFLSKKSQ